MDLTATSYFFSTESTSLFTIDQINRMTGGIGTTINAKVS